MFKRMWYYNAHMHNIRLHQLIIYMYTQTSYMYNEKHLKASARTLNWVQSLHILWYVVCVSTYMCNFCSMYTHTENPNKHVDI